MSISEVSNPCLHLATASCLRVSFLSLSALHHLEIAHESC